MDYLGLKCPVCDKYFHANDDIVVCPECGAPHHRECYQSDNKCHFEDKHCEGFDYQEYIGNETQENPQSDAVCPVCNQKNPKDTFFCLKCGSSMQQESSGTDKSNNTQSNSQGNSQIPQTGFNGIPIIIDPMGGVDPKSSFDENATASDVAKLVKTNTAYFMRVFDNIKKFSRSRFNFSGFLFGGGYFLYRKMYGIGTVLTLAMAFLMLMPVFITRTPEFTEIVQNAFSLAGISNISSYTDLFTLILASLKLPYTQFLFMFLPIACEAAIFAIMLFSGFCVNRLYYKHCIKKAVIANTKLENSDEKDIFFNSTGGVNSALGISLLIAYFAIESLPAILTALNIL